MADNEPDIIDFPRGNDVVADQALIPLYSMARGFLTNLVQTKDLSYMEEKGVDFSDWDEVVDHDYQDWIEYFLGYVIWSGIGIVLLIGMLVTGIILLCCCCCACCCCKGKSTSKSSSSSCCRITLMVILFLVTTAMLPPVGFMIISGVRLREQVQSDYNMFDTVRDGITALDIYADDTVEEMETVITGTVESLTDDVKMEFNKLENAIFVDFDKEIGASEALEDLEQLNTDLENSTPVANESLVLAKSLEDDRVVLEDELITIKDDIDASLSSCTTQECEEMKQRNDNLVPNATYTLVSLELELLSQSLSVIVDDGRLEEEVTRVNEEYNNTVSNINEDINEIAADADDEMSRVLEDMTEYIDDVKEKVNEFEFDETLDEVDKIEDDVYTPADILFWSIVGICGLVVIIIFWNYIGIIVGACCSADNSKSCSMEMGSTILKLGVAFTFLFQWIFMILLISTFISSGIFYTEFCRHMVSYNESDVSDIMDDIINGTILDSVDVSITVTDVYTDCGSDLAFYTAFDLDQNNLNITDVVYDPYVDRKIDQFRDYEIESEFSVIFMTDGLNDILDYIDATFRAFDLELHQEELAKDVVGLDIDAYINDLKDLNDDDIDQQLLEQAINDLEDLNEDLINQMTVDKQDLLDLLDELDSYIGDDDRITQLSTNLTLAEDKLNNPNITEDILERNRDHTVTEIEDLLEESRQSIINDVENNIGRCFVVYHVIANVTDEVCVKTLYPIHGFWFSLGWIYVMLVVSVILSLCLASKLRVQAVTEKSAVSKKKIVSPYGANKINRRHNATESNEMADLNDSRSTTMSYDNPIRVTDDVNQQYQYPLGSHEPFSSSGSNMPPPTVVAHVPFRDQQSSSDTDSSSDISEQPYRAAIPPSESAYAIPRIRPSTGQNAYEELGDGYVDDSDFNDWTKKRSRELSRPGNLYSGLDNGPAMEAAEPSRHEDPYSARPLSFPGDYDYDSPVTGGVRVLPPVSIQ